MPIKKQQQQISFVQNKNKIGAFVFLKKTSGNSMPLIGEKGEIRIFPPFPKCAKMVVLLFLKKRTKVEKGEKAKSQKGAKKYKKSAEKCFDAKHLRRREEGGKGGSKKRASEIGRRGEKSAEKCISNEFGSGEKGRREIPPLIPPSNPPPRDKWFPHLKKGREILYSRCWIFPFLVKSTNEWRERKELRRRSIRNKVLSHINFRFCKEKDRTCQNCLKF